MEKGKIVVCSWLDAHALDEWLYEEDFQMEPVYTVTYGVLVGENTLGIMISATTNSSGQYGSCWFIPKGAIQSLHELDYKKEFSLENWNITGWDK